MKKFLVSMFSLLLIASSANAATWVASDRVAPVGAKILEKNNLPKGVTFKVVKGDADNKYNNRCDELARMEIEKNV